MIVWAKKYSIELDVVRGHAHQVARPASRQVCGGQGVERAEEPEAHVGEEPVGNIVGQPRLQPVEEPGQGRNDEECDEPPADRSAPLHGQDGEGAHGADPDQRGNPGHPEEERGHQASTVAAAEPEEHRQNPSPSEAAPGREDGLRRPRLRLFQRGVRRVSRARLDWAVRVTPFLHLAGHEARVGAPAPEELRVPPALDDAPAFQHEDPVGADDARQPVGEDQGRAAGHEPVERRLDDGLALRVDRREGLVEDQHRRIAQQGPRDRDALALAARQPDSPLPDDGLVSLREARDERMGVGLAGCRLELGQARLRSAHPKVLGDGAVEQIGVLVDHGQEGAKVGEREVPHVATAHEHPAALGVVEAQQEPRHRRLARSARPDDGHALARPHGKGQPLVRGTAAAGIAEGHVLEGHRGRETQGGGNRAGPVADGGPHREGGPAPRGRPKGPACPGGAARGGHGADGTPRRPS